MANQHAKPAAAAMIQLRTGEPVTPAPVVMNTCYRVVTAQDAIHLASVHRFDAAARASARAQSPAVQVLPAMAPHPA
jgi:sulfite dehydrogenase